MAQKKRSNHRGASRQQSSSAATSGSAVRVFAFGFGSGVFVSFLLYLVLLPAEPGTPEGAGNEKRVTSPQGKALPGDSVAKMEYEFFEVLPSQRIEVEVDPAELPQTSPERAQKLLLLQAGSFRDVDDADRRRAELLLLGLEPTVEESNGDNGRWFRVLIGPFDSRSAMARARSLTAQQDIDTLLVQREPR
ncbi:MAG: SPOR domain-containing protein [Pseudomonadota bacterium]